MCWSLMVCWGMATRMRWFRGCATSWPWWYEHASEDVSASVTSHMCTNTSGMWQSAQSRCNGLGLESHATIYEYGEVIYYISLQIEVIYYIWGTFGESVVVLCVEACAFTIFLKLIKDDNCWELLYKTNRTVIISRYLIWLSHLFPIHSRTHKILPKLIKDDNY